MKASLAPVVLFVYNRLEHTQRTVEALRRNNLAKESELYIYSDGPKSEEDIEKVNKVRKYIRQIGGFKKISIVERDKNWGLANSIVTGVTEMIEQYGKIIVLEDDLLVSDDFLNFMNKGLTEYQHESQIYSISGYSFGKKNMNDMDMYFLKIFSSWAWATWKDRWEKYDMICEGWLDLKSNRGLRRKFDYDYSYPYFRLLKKQMENSATNSWAIKWYWTIFKNNGLTLFPSNSLVMNNGFDGSGEHCGMKRLMYRSFTEPKQVKALKFNMNIEEQITIRKQMKKVIRKQLGLAEKVQVINDMMGIGI